MPKRAIVATIEATPGRMDELMPLLMAHRARCLKDEPGTLQFDFLIPRDDKSKVLLIEIYKDDDAFQSSGTDCQWLSSESSPRGWSPKCLVLEEHLRSDRESCLLRRARCENDALVRIIFSAGASSSLRPHGGSRLSVSYP